MEISGSMVLTSVTKYSIVSEAGRNWAENLQTLAFASNPVNKTRNLSPDVNFMEQERCSELVEDGVHHSSLHTYAALWEGSIIQ